MPIPIEELNEAEDPIVIIRDFLKRNANMAWTYEEISNNTGIDMTTVYQICQLLRAKHVEAAAREEYFPIKVIERYGQTYYAWNEKARKRGKSRRSSIKDESKLITTISNNNNDTSSVDTQSV
jgi:hypothetical protein